MPGYPGYVKQTYLTYMRMSNNIICVYVCMCKGYQDNQTWQGITNP